MVNQTITCYKCQQNHYKPNTTPFKIKCHRCGTIIGSDNGEALWYDLSNYNQNWNGKAPKAPADKMDIGLRLIQYLFVGGLGLILLSGVFLSINSVTEWFNDDSETSTTKVVNTSPISQPSIETENNRDTSTVSYHYPDAEPKESIEVYSGRCTYSKKELDGNLMTLKPISSGFAKVVINRKLNKLYFYYNNKLVFHYFNYSSYADDIEGGEGFNFDSDADAHRFIAERVFQLNTERIMGGQLGYQYEITNYKEN